MIVHAFYLKDARVRRYAEMMVKEGHEVDIICLREGGEPHFEEYYGVRIYRIDKSRHRGGIASYVIEYVSAFFSFFIKLNKLFFTSRRYDLIHIHNFPNFLVFVSIIQKILGRKVILDVHDPMPELFSSKFRVTEKNSFNRLLYLEERLSTRFVDHVIAANHYFKDNLVQRGCPAQKITVVMNAPDDNFLSFGSDICNSNRDSGNFNILYVGTLAERYGLKTALRAIAKIKREERIPGICFTVIPKLDNEGIYVNKLLREVKALGLDSCFRLLDSVSHEQMPEIIRSADLSVYTPMPDVHMDIALSLKIPEIIAIGRPLVTSRLSVLERYFGEDALFMFEPGNVENCADKILEIYQKPEEAQLRVKRAQKALNNISWKTQKIIYQDIIKNFNNQHHVNNKQKSGVPTSRMHIKRLARKVISSVAYYSGLSSIWYWLFGGRAVRILAYHAIELVPTNSYSVSLNNFIEQIEHLKKHYNVISLTKFQKILDSKESFPRKTIILTFDDGFRDFYERAYPILKKYKLPATCFIMTSKAESSDEKFMHWDEAQQIVEDELVTIGSHTVSHKSLTSLNNEALKHEVEDSKSMIEQKLGISVDFFSYPYGTPRDFNDHTAQTISTGGYKLACTSINGINSKHVNPFKLRRTKIEWGDDLPTFKRILWGALDILVIMDHWFNFLQNKREVEFN